VVVLTEENILDPTCGPRSIWYKTQRDRDDVLYFDKREEDQGFAADDHPNVEIQPDKIQDFRDLPYEDERFDLIVWDPPHKTNKKGMEQLTGIIEEKYGALHAETWQSDLHQGFVELWRVLCPGGSLVFKFANNSIDFEDVLSVFPEDPLFGTTTTQNARVETRWFLFYEPRDKQRKTGDKPE